GTVTNIATVTGEVPGEDPEDPNEPETPTPPETDVHVSKDPLDINTPDEPKQSEKPTKKLPQTSEKQTGVMMIGLVMIVFSIIGFYARKKWIVK
ncbi:LPXTG cell wall anchor domain-containing protein, partial [uncultured Virgibacillus sp.]